MDFITHQDLRTNKLAWGGVDFDWELERLPSAVAFISQLIRRALVQGWEFNVK